MQHAGLTEGLRLLNLTSSSKPLPIEEMIETLQMEPKIKNSLRFRYINLLKEFRKRAWRLSLLFHGTRMVATVGSIITSSLLSIQYTTVGGADYSDPSAISEQNRRIFWITWCISFFVTVSNALLTLFKLDKKYYFVHTTLEQLISEGWQYIELTAKYSGFYTPLMEPTYENQYLYFCHAVEKIKMRQVEEEYYKLSELHANISSTGNTNQHQQQLVVTSAAAATAAIPPSVTTTTNQEVHTVSVPPPPANPNTNSILPLSPFKQLNISQKSQVKQQQSQLPVGIAKYFGSEPQRQRQREEQEQSNTQPKNVSENQIVENASAASEGGEKENQKESTENSKTE